MHIEPMIGDEHWLETLVATKLHCRPEVHHMNVTTIRDTCSRIYQMIYISDYKDPESANRERQDALYNQLATYLLPERTQVWGMVAIIAFEETDTACPSARLDMSEVEMIVNRRELATTATVAAHTEHVSTEAEMSCARIIDILSDPNTPMIERRMFGDIGYHLVGWQQRTTHDISVIINKTATRLLGRRVTGTWTFTVYRSDSCFLDVTSAEIAELESVCMAPLDVVNQSTPDDVPQQRREAFNTRFRILRNRSAHCQPVCQKCGSQASTLKVCTGCYRMRYCGSECQQEHRQLHAADCQRSTPIGDQ